MTQEELNKIIEQHQHWIKEDIKMLCMRKDSITKRMKDLLDKT